MNLILLFDEDFVEPAHVRLTGRRMQHVRDVHRAEAGDDLTVGVAGGMVGRGHVTRLDHEALEMDVDLLDHPPPPLPLTLILAVPRPKVLNRVIASASSLGIKRIRLINAWRVEKSYWSSPRMTPASLRHQSVLGLEQARDTMLPEITTHRFFRQFVEEEFAPHGRMLVAHPTAAAECPRDVRGDTVLAIGPEGGFITAEIESFEAIGFEPVTIGPRPLRVETALAAIVGRLCG